MVLVYLTQTYCSQDLVNESAFTVEVFIPNPYKICRKFPAVKVPELILYQFLPDYRNSLIIRLNPVYQFL